MNVQIDRDYIIQKTKDMVQINSVNPSLSPGGKGEAEIGTYVADVLSDLGLDVKLYKLKPDRVNVVGILKGVGEGRSLLLNAHLDTVGVDGMIIDPFGAEIRNGRLYGRGSQDMKGSLAAMMGAAKAFVDTGIELAGDLIITGVADEEYASIGSEDLVRHVSADGAIVTEPTDLSLCRAHRGFIWHEVETFGRAAHGSRFKEGVDANMRMGRFLAQLDNLEQELRNRPAHPLVGPPSLHAARIRGGLEISTYAAHCLLEIERRTNPGETESQATAEIQSIIDRLESDDPTFKASLKATFWREPFEVGEEALLVKILEDSMTNQLGSKPAHSGQTFWTDAALFAAAGMETALVGPVGNGLHSEEEWVDLQSVVDLAHILAETAIKYCR
ncbi:MAG: ArgE/DapE family deacylase [Anaerolineales bacterium]|uniref:Probable succinyl-diaminopimelate desuccinylase n=1 Tax=Candidatus Desulfolinea nitratireducens TaxID=2841698 RepID=A0A8J6NM58_9CHLR|nr:ArgE/DapE family deacylase [Candidatus Desulfolinea nitratireducens]